MSYPVDQPHFHVTDPAKDWMFRNSLYVGRGNLTAAAATRLLNSNLDAVISLYEAFTSEREKEEVFECVRSNDFPDQPSRLGCLFLFKEPETAKRCNEKWWGGRGVIHEARIVSARNVGVFDAHHLDVPAAEYETAARRYWNGENTDEPVLEVLLVGTMYIAEWKEYARLPRPGVDF